MMNRRIPPPIALRSFEAAARHMSFTQAADELNVTQAAVSHQVKLLEEYLQTRLFERLTRRLRLTAHGQALYDVVGEAFERIAQIADRLKQRVRHEPLTISLTPYFAAKWLTPRLDRFWRQYPNIDLRLHHSRQPGNAGSTDVDLAISWGRDKWPGLSATRLLNARIIPVCSPALLKSGRPLRTLTDMRSHTLLHENDYELWNQWLKAIGAESGSVQHGSTIDDSNVVLQAAIEGQGIALGADALLRDELESGRLIAPFDRSLATEFSYYLVYEKAALKRPKVKAFYDWMREEVAAERKR